MAKDKRPPVWIGHLTQSVKNVSKMEAFYRKLGMRSILKRPSFSILELRAGTHILLFKKPKGSDLKHDLMVEDVRRYHNSLKRKKIKVGRIMRGRIHDSFIIVSPDGTKIRVNSDHSSGRPV